VKSRGRGVLIFTFNKTSPRRERSPKRREEYLSPKVGGLEPESSGKVAPDFDSSLGEG